MFVNILHFVVIMCVIKSFSVNCFNLKTTTREFRIKVNENVEFECTVEGSDYKPYLDVMTWTKFQIGTTSTTKLVTQLADLQEPFRSTNRHNVAFSELSTKLHELRLTITRARYEDTGTYMCKVGQFKVNMTLMVIEEVKSLSIYGSSNSTDKWKDLQPASGQLRFDGSVPGMIQCVAHGGYPPAIMSITVDNLQKTGHFTYNEYCNLTGNTEGLQAMSCVSWKGSQSYTPSSIVNQKIFKCRAHVDTLVPEKSTSVTLLINGVPVYIEERCPNIVYAREGDKNVQLVCEITGFPSPSRISWRVDTSGVDVTSNNPKMIPNSQTVKFSSVNLVKQNDAIVVTLNIGEVVKADFKTYILNVANVKGEMTPRQIELKRGSRTGGSTLAASSISVSPLLLVLLLLGTLFHCIDISR